MVGWFLVVCKLCEIILTEMQLRAECHRCKSLLFDTVPNHIWYKALAVTEFKSAADVGDGASLSTALLVAI